MFDFSILFGSFSTTEITITPVTDAAKAALTETFGSEVESFNMTKGEGLAFEEYCIRRGLTYKVVG